MKNINRRSFLQTGGLLLSSAMLSSAFLTKKKYKLGLQLYTIRDAMAQDVKGTLKKVADFGYQEVEIYGFADAKYYGFEPKEFRSILDDLNLYSPSGHYDLNTLMFPDKTNDDLKKYIDNCITGAKALSQKYIVWPWLNPEFRDIESFKRVAEKLSLIGEQTAKAGLTVLYHNHDFEFVESGGTNGYEIILTETDPDKVKIQLDLFWVTHSSKTRPQEYFKRYPGRFVSWHLKDMNKQNRDLHEVMGEGSINFFELLKDAELAGAQHMLVEQGNNYHPDAMDNVSRSAKYVKNVLFK